MTGKEKCRCLKEIRQRIAEENDIALVVEECTHKGECRGTCPRCEAELRYLEQQLERRQRLGKTVVVAALSASLLLTSSCSVIEEAVEILSPRPTEEIEVLEGEVPMEFELDGDVEAVYENELTGLVPYDGYVQP